jgi:hypothetical protein
MIRVQITITDDTDPQYKQTEAFPIRDDDYKAFKGTLEGWNPANWLVAEMENRIEDSIGHSLA